METKEISKFKDNTVLKEFLETEFLPKFIAIKQRKINGTYEDYFTIELQHITNLKLSFKEEEYVRAYLLKHDINIVLTTTDLETSNYEYIRTYKESLTLKDNNAILQKIKEYQKTKDFKIREQIIIDNIRLVSFAAYRYSLNRKIDIHELESYGYEGLIELIENYDVNCEYDFCIMANNAIKNAIRRGLSKDYVNLKYDYEFTPYKKNIERATNKRIEKNPELLDEIILDIEKDGRIGTKNFAIRLKEKLNEKNPDSIYNVKDIKDIETQNVELEIEKIIIREQLLASIDTLPPQQQEIIKIYFDLNDDKEVTLVELAAKYDVTLERIRQLKEKALVKLHKLLKDEKFFIPDEFIDNTITNENKKVNVKFETYLVEKNYNNKRFI